MEELSNSLFFDQVPASWARKAYPSLYGLTAWYADLLQRVKELETWTSDFQLPAAVWLAGFFNPQSFLTAIMQQMARKNEWPLDRMCLQCDVTKKSREDMAGPPREGMYFTLKLWIWYKQLHRDFFFISFTGFHVCFLFKINQLIYKVASFYVYQYESEIID